jgi:hypothetical protein
MAPRAIVHIVRTKQRRSDRGRAYRVLIDGAEGGRVRNGEVISVPVSSGHHELRLKIDWTGSAPCEFDLLLTSPGVV